MTGRRAYEMFTRAFGRGTSYWNNRPTTQFGDGPLLAYDDLTRSEQEAWRRLASQVDRTIARSKAASRAVR